MTKFTGKPVDAERAKALARFDSRVVRLEDTARTLAQLLDRAVESIKVSMFSGLGYTTAELTDTDLKKLKEVTAAFNSATDAQVRLDKTAGQRAKAMTHDERKQAVADFIMTLPMHERSEWLVAAVKRHDDLKGGGRRLQTSPSMDGFKEADDGDA